MNQTALRMNRQVQAVIEALERQGHAVGIPDRGRTIFRPEDGLSTLRLRFDKVALRFIADVQSALGESVPDGKTLMFTITAPIRLASKTAGALEDKVRRSLARPTARIDMREAINGNRLRVRLVARGAKGTPKVIGFVHNPDTDADVLLRVTEALLAQSDTGAKRRVAKAIRTASAGEEKGMKKTGSEKSASPSRLIDGRIRELDDWRGAMLSRLRAIVKEADPEVVEEWKWRGVPVWNHDGIICTGETYRSVVKMTFARGAALKDPSRLFNSSLEGNVRRAIDFREGEKINEKALKDLIRAAVTLNKSKGKK
jgi:hypothetical protein